MITAVVFDLGGVLTGPPYAGVAVYEAEVGLPAGSLLRYFRGDVVMSRLERGEITAREYWKSVGTRVQEAHGIRIDLGALAGSTEASSHLVPEALDLVRALHGRYVLGLLTNNVGEARVWRDQLPHELFDVIIDSSAVGLRKPDPRIYELLLARLARPAREVVFVDDFEENLPPAAALGINVVAFENVAECRTALEALGVKTE